MRAIDTQFRSQVSQRMYILIAAVRVARIKVSVDLPAGRDIPTCRSRKASDMVSVAVLSESVLAAFLSSLLSLAYDTWNAARAPWRLRHPVGERRVGNRQVKALGSTGLSARGGIFFLFSLSFLRCF